MSASVLVNRAPVAGFSPAAAENNVVQPLTSLRSAYEAESGPDKFLALLVGSYGAGETITVPSGTSLTLHGIGIMSVVQAKIIVSAGGALYLQNVGVLGSEDGPTISGGGHISSSVVAFAINPAAPRPILVATGTVYFENCATAAHGIAMDCSGAASVEIRGTLRVRSSVNAQVISFGAGTVVQGDQGTIESLGGGVQIVGPLGTDGRVVQFRLRSLRMLIAGEEEAPITEETATATELSAVAFTGFDSVAAPGSDSYRLFIQMLEVAILEDMDTIGGEGAYIVAATDTGLDRIDDLGNSNITLRIEQLAVNDVAQLGGNTWANVLGFEEPDIALVAAGPLNA